MEIILGIFNVRIKFTRKSQFPDSVFQIFWWIFRFEMSLAVLNCFSTFRQDAMNRDDGKLRLNSFKHPQSSTKFNPPKEVVDIFLIFFFLLYFKTNKSSTRSCWTLHNKNEWLIKTWVQDYRFFLLIEKRNHINIQEIFFYTS